MPTDLPVPIRCACSSSVQEKMVHLEMVGNSNRASAFSSEKMTGALQTESVHIGESASPPSHEQRDFPQRGLKFSIGIAYCSLPHLWARLET